MNRRADYKIIADVLIALLVAGAVGLAGGPAWAMIMAFAIIYFSIPT